MKKKLFFAFMALPILLSSAAGCKGEEEDVPPPEPASYISYQTENGTKIAPVIDIQPQLNWVAHDYERVRTEVNIIKGAGFTRVYFVLCNPGYPVFSNPTLAPTPSSRSYFLTESDRLLDYKPHLAYAKACKEAGLEAIAIIKPYEGGGGTTVPAGKTADGSAYHEATVGGSRVYFDKFISENPGLRVIRKPGTGEQDLSDMPITEIEMAFMLDSFENDNGGGSVTSFGGTGLTTLAGKRFSIWISRDNGSYELYTGPYTKTIGADRIRINDANGLPLFAGESRCSILTISGLQIPAEYGYAAVAFEDASSLFTLPYSMIKLYSGETELACSVTRFVRSPADESDKPDEHVWGNEKLPVAATELKGIKVVNGLPAASLFSGGSSGGAENFYKWGFEFYWYGVGHSGNGWGSSPIYGIARGKSRYLQGTLCEAYPEVREYWLGMVKDIIDWGFDGVDIRLSGHSSMIYDYASYGYNEPIIEKYKQLYGVDILKEEADPFKIMQIRGGFFMEFLEDAAELLHENEKRLLVHLLSGDENPALSSHTSQVGHWSSPKIIIDWKRAIDLADELTIKDNMLSGYDPGVCANMKSYAKSAGKPVWVHCYIQQGGSLTQPFLEAAVNDPLNDGILLYEITFRNDYNLSLINDVKYFMRRIGCEAVEIKR